MKKVSLDFMEESSCDLYYEFTITCQTSWNGTELFIPKIIDLYRVSGERRRRILNKDIIELVEALNFQEYPDKPKMLNTYPISKHNTPSRIAGMIAETVTRNHGNFRVDRLQALSEYREMLAAFNKDLSGGWTHPVEPTKKDYEALEKKVADRLINYFMCEDEK